MKNDLHRLFAAFLILLSASGMSYAIAGGVKAINEPLVAVVATVFFSLSLAMTLAYSRLSAPSK